jgi:hypothetical protein
MSTAPAQTTATRVTTVIAVVIVAFIAALVSYFHVQQIANQAGEAWRSWLFPAMYDGLMVAASMVLITRKRAQESTSWLAWGALGSGVVMSLAANVADAISHRNPIWLAGSAPLVFAIGFELLLQQRKTTVASSEQSATLTQPVVDQRRLEPREEKVSSAIEPSQERLVGLGQSENTPQVNVQSVVPVVHKPMTYPKPTVVQRPVTPAVSAVGQSAKVTAADVRACRNAHPSWTNAQVAQRLGISVETLYRRLKEARAS